MSMHTRPDVPRDVRVATARGERRGGGPLFEFVRRYPLISFYLLACGASWFAWMPYVLSNDGLGLEDFSFPKLLGDAQLLGVLPGAYIGPLGAALVVTWINGGREGLRDWRRRLFKLRVKWYWYPIVLAGVPITLIVGTLLTPGAADGMRLPPAMVLVAFLPALLLQVVTTGLAEEPGWRDFALPLMQRRLGPAAGTAVLGVVWAVWHFPLFFTGWSLAGPRPDNVNWYVTVGVFVLMCIAISYLITWVFNHTEESLPVALVLHAANNTVASIVLPEMFPNAAESVMVTGGAIGYGIIAAVLLIATRGRLGYTGPRD
ncbi:type II CAAX endopeptidase family protein [Spirillospora sp. NPDC029432]|uniref:type II CAAX endopeptidase family protein n=1 Tax=Spirillospora sp. NPDC029432 TaxID=3154599 RepID=UPI00345326FF